MKKGETGGAEKGEATISQRARYEAKQVTYYKTAGAFTHQGVLRGQGKPGNGSQKP